MTSKEDKINQIKDLLEEISQGEADSDKEIFHQNFDALELPIIIEAIVDTLQPQLTTYEAALYWYMFRHSIIARGQQYVFVSTRGLMKGVVLSSSGRSDDLSLGTVRKSLLNLEKKGAISKQAEPNREGTLYKVCLPEEIEICKKLRKEKEEQREGPIDESKELDFYNVRENRLKIFERDNYVCHYCGKQLTRFTATLDHIQPVSEGGDNSADNLITSCLHCNSRRGSRPVMDMYEDGKT